MVELQENEILEYKKILVTVTGSLYFLIFISYRLLFGRFFGYCGGWFCEIDQMIFFLLFMGGGVCYVLGIPRAFKSIGRTKRSFVWLLSLSIVLFLLAEALIIIRKLTW